MNTYLLTGGVGLFAIVGGVDYALDRNVTRALIVGAVAVAAAYVIVEYYLIPAAQNGGLGVLSQAINDQLNPAS